MNTKDILTEEEINLLWEDRDDYRGHWDCVEHELESLYEELTELRKELLFCEEEEDFDDIHDRIMRSNREIAELEPLAETNILKRIAKSEKARYALNLMIPGVE